MSILLAFHLSSSNEAHLIAHYFRLKGYRISLIDEERPEKLSARSQAIKDCACLVLMTSRRFQTSLPCMEVLNYARDWKKEIFGINTCLTYKPFGALGAVVLGSDNGLIKITEFGEEVLNKSLEPIIAYLTVKNVLPNHVQPAITPSTISPHIELEHVQEAVDVLISHHTESKEIAELISSALNNQQIGNQVEDCTQNRTRVKSAKLLIVVMSQEYENSFASQTIVETARQLNKPLVPVSITKQWKPSEWLGLVVAGKLFFRILNATQAYESKSGNSADTFSTPMNELISTVIIDLVAKPNFSQREQLLIESLNKRIDECKAKLAKWPPKQRDRVIADEKPVKVELKKREETLEFFYTHYTVTRMGHAQPKSLFDNHGVPLRDKFDCMISYQWQYQKLVREFFYDLHMKNLSIWFDIWGGMQGNTYEAMATAVECSKLILVILSDKYQNSDNCKLELRYALNRGKPFVFINVEANLKLAEWIKPVYNEWPHFDLFKIEDLGEKENGVPRIELIQQAIRDIGAAQPDNQSFELSDEIVSLQNLLNDALDDLDESTGRSRFKTCTRCHAKYEEDNPIGCKRHSAYYLGGGLMAGQWVCCSQQEEDAVGCSNTEHIDLPREWKMNPDYGTWSFEPP